MKFEAIQESSIIEYFTNFTSDDINGINRQLARWAATALLISGRFKHISRLQPRAYSLKAGHPLACLHINDGEQSGTVR